MPHREDMDAVFALLVEAAVNDWRCPKNSRPDNPKEGIPSGATNALVREGKIRVEVYGTNYRVVEILWGRNAGKRTRGPENKNWKPYKVLPKPEASSIKE